MIDVCLKDGTNINFRVAVKEDASNVIDFYNIVGGETDFLSFGGNEFKATVESEQKYIEDIDDEDNSIMVIAFDEGKIIGIATINSSQKARLKHVGILGIVVRKEYCGKGIGKILMEYLIDFSKSNGITKKISLVTRQDNLNAIKLYEKLGFETEGILKSDNYEKGIYYNTLSMALFL